MSKNLLALTALLTASLFFASTVIAQEDDFDGFGEPEPTSTQPTTTVTEKPFVEEPVGTRTERLTNLKMAEQNSIQTVKTKYIEAVTLQNSNLQSGLPASASTAYKINALLVSARYHETLDLYITYLLKLEQSFDEYSLRGFEVSGGEVALDAAEQELNALSNDLIQYDFATDNFTETNETDLANFTPDLLNKTTVIKTQLQATKTSLLDLVEMVE